jgi:hypothetical protein
MILKVITLYILEMYTVWNTKYALDSMTLYYVCLLAVGSSSRVIESESRKGYDSLPTVPPTPLLGPTSFMPNLLPWFTPVVISTGLCSDPYWGLK